MEIPLMTDKVEQARATAKCKALQGFFKGQNWKFDDQLRAVASWLYHNPRLQRKKQIDWLSDLLEDLRATR